MKLLLALVLSLALTSCSLNMAIPNSPTGAALTLTAPSNSIVNVVTFVAKINGPISWCPTKLVWMFDNGSELENTTCQERIFTNRWDFKGPGRHWGYLMIYDEDESFIAQTSPLTVIIGGSLNN